MKVCPNCFKYGTSKFCSDCGLELVEPQDRCPNCKRQVYSWASSRFCPDCGLPILPHTMSAAKKIEKANANFGR